MGHSSTKEKQFDGATHKPDTMGELVIGKFKPSVTSPRAKDQKNTSSGVISPRLEQCEDVEKIKLFLSKPKPIAIDRSLIKINLEGFKLQEQTMKMFCTALKSSNAVEILILKQCQLGTGEAQELSQFLQQNSSIVDLDVANNNIEDVGLHSITESLKKTTSIKKLSVANNNINDEGASHISTLISISKTIASIDISGISNMITLVLTLVLIFDRQ